VEAEILAIKEFKGVGDVFIRTLLAKAPTSRDELLDFSYKMIANNKNIDTPSPTDFENRFYEYLDKSLKKLDNLENLGIGIVPCYSEKYPTSLKKLKDYPVFIYYKGNLDLLRNKPSVAVVGTRRSSPRGESIAFKTAQYFSCNNVIVVSGLAVGIDSAGHRGALQGPGGTIAVLVEVDKVYPKENRDLATEILDTGGLLLAENAPKSYISKQSFVLRDRLQSALSTVLFVIETDIKGGTMHTVKYAQELEKRIYCPRLESVRFDQEYVGARGIRYLLDNKVASPYTQDDYSTILEYLIKQVDESSENNRTNNDYDHKNKKNNINNNNTKNNQLNLL